VKARRLGLVAYEPTWRAMQAFNAARTGDTRDEAWLVEHPPVFTLGLAGRREHVHEPGDIPVIATDRGGQVTFHGPGQAILYALVDLRRNGLGVKQMVRLLEEAAIGVLAAHAVPGERVSGRPGVYVEGRKIAAVGLRVSRGCTYHGIAFNVALPLEPFTRIDPCGYAGLECTSLAKLGVRASIVEVHHGLARALINGLETAAVPA
jgi:lipoyl(octanoyl) transferase